MKAKILLFTVVSAMLFAGCNEFNDEFEQTAVGNMSGEWYCYIADFDYWFTLTTYNNNANQAGKLMISDMGTFWGGFQVEGDCNLSDMTFSVPNGVKSKQVFQDTDNIAVVPYDIEVRVANGKMTPGVVTLPSKSIVDKIEFSISFSGEREYDDRDGGPIIEDGVLVMNPNVAPFADVFNVVGYRKSGFEEDAEIADVLQ